ncbi:hypothetical protein Tco_1452130 [Tanacetum coccineum]
MPVENLLAYHCTARAVENFWAYTLTSKPLENLWAYTWTARAVENFWAYTWTARAVENLWAYTWTATPLFNLCAYFPLVRAELILEVEKQGYLPEVYESLKLLKDLQETDNAKARAFMRVINETEIKILEKISLIVQFRKK